LTPAAAGALKGARGIPGERGPTGASGSVGPPGSAGVVGRKGATGATGSTGARGATGTTGAVGPVGPVATFTASSIQTLVPTTSCKNYTGGTVTVVAPTSGSVIVHAQALAFVIHTLNVEDQMRMFIGASNVDCSPATSAVAFVPPAEPSNTYESTLTSDRVFTATAGSHTYYLNGTKPEGTDPDDEFLFGSMWAEFVPAS
jgi:hypothetical protein